MTSAFPLILFQLVNSLGLSFTNARELNAIVDNSLSSAQPHFIQCEIKVVGEVFKVFYCDVTQCIYTLYSDPKFKGILVFTPEHHYADTDHTVHVYFNLHTGQWWWDTQVCAPDTYKLV